MTGGKHHKKGKKDHQDPHKGGAPPGTSPLKATPTTPSSFRRHDSVRPEKAPAFVKHKVIFEKEYGSCVVREFAGINVNGSTLLPSFPASSLASTIMTAYLIEQLDLQLVGVVFSSLVEARAIIKDGQPAFPIRIYGNEHLSVITSELELEPQVQHELVDVIYDFANRHLIEHVILSEGQAADTGTKLEDLDLGSEEDEEDEDSEPQFQIKQSAEERSGVCEVEGVKKKLSDEEKKAEKEKEKAKEKEKKEAKKKAKRDEKEYEDPDDVFVWEKAFFLTTNPKFQAKMEELGLKIVANGQVSGVTGGVLSEAMFNECSVSLVVAPTLGKLGDANAGASLVKVLDQWFEKVEIKTDKLEEHNQELEESIKKILDRMTKGQKSGSAPMGMYM